MIHVRSIFLDSWYLLSRGHRILIFLFQITFFCILALVILLRLPMPGCRPLWCAKESFFFSSTRLGMYSHKVISPFWSASRSEVQVCIGNFTGFVRVQPDLLATFKDTRNEPLLNPEHTHSCSCHSEREGKKSIFLSETSICPLV